MGDAGSPCFIRFAPVPAEIAGEQGEIIAEKWLGPVNSLDGAGEIAEEVSLMREMRVVYNPEARRGRFISRVDSFIEQAQKRDFRLSFYRLSGNREDADRIFAQSAGRRSRGGLRRGRYGAVGGRRHGAARAGFAHGSAALRYVQ